VFRFTNFHRWLLYAGFAVALVLVASPFKGYVDVALASHAGQYHWARQNPSFTLKLVSKLTGNWNPSLDLASAAWTTTGKLDTVIVSGPADPTSRFLCAPVPGTTVVCNYTYGLTGWSGRADVWSDSRGHITRATVKMNDSYSWGVGKMQYRMCQQVGRTLGLSYQDTTSTNTNFGSCMDKTKRPFGPPSNLGLNAHDHMQLNLVYRHTDAYTTLAKETSAVKPSSSLEDIDSNQPDQWGRRGRSVGGGQTEVYERYFGNGERVVTFVILAKQE